MSIVDIKKMNSGFVLPGQEQIDEWVIGYQIVMCPSISKGKVI